MRLLQLTGHLEDAARVCAATLATDEGLAQRSPDSAVAQEDVALDLRNLAQVELARGHAARARDLFGQMKTIAETQAKKHGDMGSWRWLVPESWRGTALSEAALGHLDAARDASGAARATLQAPSAASPDPQLDETRGDVLAAAGDVSRARGEAAEAEQSYRDAIVAYESLVTRGLSTRDARASLARVRSALGKAR